MFLPKNRCFATCFLDEQVNRSDLPDAERERHNELSTARSSVVYCQVGTVGWHSHTCQSMGRQISSFQMCMVQLEFVVQLSECLTLQVPFPS